MKRPLRIGDRVRVYGVVGLDSWGVVGDAGSIRTGVVFMEPRFHVDSPGEYLGVTIQGRRAVFSVKQCRRLKSRKSKV